MFDKEPPLFITIICSIFCLIAFGFTIGEQYADNESTLNLVDIFTIFGVIFTLISLLFMIWIALKWRAQLLETKLIEHVINSTKDIIFLQNNTSVTLTHIQLTLSRYNLTNINCPQKAQQIIKEIENTINNYGKKSQESYLNFVAIEHKLDILLRENHKKYEKLKNAFINFRGIAYISNFAKFTIKINAEDNKKKLTIPISYKITDIEIVVYYPREIEKLNIDFIIHNLHLDTSEKFYENTFNLEELEQFYSQLNGEGIRKKDILLFEINNSLT